MIIDIQNNKIRITEYENVLKPRHKSQLFYWGFKVEVGGILIYPNNDLKEYLIDLIEYLNDAKIDFVLSDSCKKEINSIQYEKEIFSETIKEAKEFKDGFLDKKNWSIQQKFLNESIVRPLKEHQIKAFLHLSILGNGANFSVPGSGKTTVVLAHYEMLRKKGDVNLLFVVGPAACFAPWKSEFNLVLNRAPNCVILAGGDKTQRKSKYYKTDKIPELYLTTFQTLLNDKEEITFFLKNRKVKAYFVVDEAHYLKRIDGQWASAVLEIAKYAKSRCALTGTPIPHSYSDLFNLFDFLWPEQKPINKNDRALIVSLEEQNRFEEAQVILDKEIGPLFYRVRKSELNLKPQIFHEPILIDMNPIERQIYDAIIYKIRDYAKDDYLRNIEIVRRLRKGRMMRVRQCLSFSQLLSTAIGDYDGYESFFSHDSDLEKLILEYGVNEIPAKINKLTSLVHNFQTQRKKTVIWSNFIGTVNLIEKEIKNRGWSCKKIIGEIPIEKVGMEEEETREKIIEKFTDSDSGLDILIANPAACAESISLHKTCHNAIYYDLSYNAAQYLQSLDRIHRVGGSEFIEANYYFLQYNNSIDSDILNNLLNKAKKMYDVIEGDYNIYSLDMDEFEENSDFEAYQTIFGKI
ncbi:MAG: DEAD/DEAH box helicase [Anaerolineaceae bacterium]|nr:DEAD/DEAH box helicase [Anaerolineaceae bacterium]